MAARHHTNKPDKAELNIRKDIRTIESFFIQWNKTITCEGIMKHFPKVNSDVLIRLIKRHNLES